MYIADQVQHAGGIGRRVGGGKNVTCAEHNTGAAAIKANPARAVAAGAAIDDIENGVVAHGERSTRGGSHHTAILGTECVDGGGLSGGQSVVRQVDRGIVIAIGSRRNGAGGVVEVAGGNGLEAARGTCNTVRNPIGRGVGTRIEQGVRATRAVVVGLVIDGMEAGAEVDLAGARRLLEGMAAGGIIEDSGAVNVEHACIVSGTAEGVNASSSHLEEAVQSSHAGGEGGIGRKRAVAVRSIVDRRKDITRA